MNRVDIPRQVAITLLHHAQQSPEKEVCGLIAATEGEPSRVIPMRNVAGSDAKHRFEMDERELIDVMKGLRQNKETLFATWHSHPDAAPELSRTDLERLGYDDALHLVISMQTRGVLQMQGWRIDEGEARAVEIGIIEQ